MSKQIIKELTLKRKKRINLKKKDLFISSAYHPVDFKDQTIFNNYLSSIYDTIPSSYIVFSGQDMNASIGVSNNTSKCKNVGKFGFNNRNLKGVEAVNILMMNSLYAALTFFKHNNIATWKSFDVKNTPYQLDQWVTSHIKHILDCKVTRLGVPSDHSAILLKIKFKTLMKKKNNIHNNIDWDMFLEEDIKRKIQ